MSEIKLRVEALESDLREKSGLLLGITTRLDESGAKNFDLVRRIENLD